MGRGSPVPQQTTYSLFLANLRYTCAGIFTFNIIFSYTYVGISCLKLQVFNYYQYTYIGIFAHICASI